MTTAMEEKLKIGPREGMDYPIIMTYCGNCTMPIEVLLLFLGFSFFYHNLFLYFQYCELYPEFDKCKKWLEKNLPSEFSKLEVKGKASVPEGVPAAVAGEEDAEGKKRQKRGGKGMIKANKKKEDDDKDKKISVSRAPRGKKKSVTVIHGLSTFGKLLNAKVSNFNYVKSCRN